MIKNKLIWITVPLICFTLYDNRKKIYNGYKWLQIWSTIKGIRMLKLCGLWWKETKKMTPDEIFTNKYKIKFLDKLKLAIKGENYNQNILEIYYDKKKFNEIITQYRNNEYELIWKTRIILVNTPYGNIGMNYDLYNRAFLYYSDIKNIPYNILICVSMHYVNIYQCLDFYVDNTIMEEWKSPYWIIWEEQKDEPKTNNPYIKRIETNNKFNENKKIMVKLKNYRLDLNEDNKIIYNKNKFIYCGKITDMPGFHIKKQVKQLQPKKISFTDYKKMISMVPDDDDDNNDDAIWNIDENKITYYETLFR